MILPSYQHSSFSPLAVSSLHSYQMAELTSCFLAVGLNIFLGLFFRASAKGYRSISSWREEKEGALPRHHTGSTAQVHFMDGPSRSASIASQKTGYGFGRQGEKAANLKGTCELCSFLCQTTDAMVFPVLGFMISKPVESLTRYAPSSKV